jgi:hypothetical protein
MSTRRSSGLTGPKLQFGGPGEPPTGPWNQPPPPAPGPMAPPDGYYPPPAPAKKGFPWGPVLIGCGLIIVIAMLVGGVSCYMMSKKLSEGGSSLMDFAKVAYLNNLTPDHTDEQRKRFESLLNSVWTDERNRLGFTKWSTSYQPVINDLTQISSDNKITVEESTEWCDKAYYALEKNGYWSQGGSENPPK